MSKIDINIDIEDDSSSDINLHIKNKAGEIIKTLEDKTIQLINKHDYENVWDTYCSKYERQPDILPKVRRIIVIGDIHGDFELLIKSLKVAKVIDDNHNWIGDDTIIVQVGDQIDRCRSSDKPCNKKGATPSDEGNDWEILQYMTELHNKASKSNGKGAVYSLIGNHELMNVDGDFRYVSYEGIQEFDIKTYREDENFIKYYKDKHPDGNINNATGDDIRRWVFSPGNPVSNFLACTRKIAIIIGSNLFVHAGILPHIARKYNIKSINILLTLFLLKKIKKSEYKDILGNGSKGPLWTRDFAKVKSHRCDKLLKPLEKIYNVNKIYVGHTPMMTKGITDLCDSRIWLTDYGASTAFNPYDDINSNKDISEIKFSNRSEPRKVQVLEILDDTKINILF